MHPLAMIGASLGASALNKLVLSRIGGTKGFDPRKHADQFLMSPGEAGMLRNIGRRSIGEQTTAGLGAFKSSAAAENLPSAAVASGISRITGEGNKAVSSWDMGVERERHNRRLNYLRTLEDFENRMAERTAAGFNFTPEMGLLTRAIVLYKMGFLGGEGTAQTAQEE